MSESSKDVEKFLDENIPSLRTSEIFLEVDILRFTMRYYLINNPST